MKHNSQSEKQRQLIELRKKLSLLQVEQSELEAKLNQLNNSGENIDADLVRSEIKSIGKLINRLQKEITQLEKELTIPVNVKQPVLAKIPGTIKVNKDKYVENLIKEGPVFPNHVYQNFESDFINENNPFFDFLLNGKFGFDEAEIKKVISMYRLGTYRVQKGGYKLLIPFINAKNAIEYVDAVTINPQYQYQFYDNTDLSNIIAESKTKTPDWYRIYQAQWDYRHKAKEDKSHFLPLFGEHILKKYPNNMVGIVESPTTAVIMTLLFGLPDPKKPETILWLSFDRNLEDLPEPYRVANLLEDRKIFICPEPDDLVHVYDWFENTPTSQRLVSWVDYFDVLLQDMHACFDWLGFCTWFEHQATEFEREEMEPLEYYLLKNKIECDTFRNLYRNPWEFVNQFSLKEINPCETTGLFQDLDPQVLSSAPPAGAVVVAARKPNSGKNVESIFEQNQNILDQAINSLGTETNVPEFLKFISVCLVILVTLYDNKPVCKVLSLIVKSGLNQKEKTILMDALILLCRINGVDPILTVELQQEWFKITSRE